VNSPIVYRGDRLPAELSGNIFIAEPTGNLVSRIHHHRRWHKHSAGAKAYANAEFLASTDERFRPVLFVVGARRTIYVVDIYHGIIQQKGFITEYLRDHIVAKKLEQPIHMGRIFRIVHDTTKRDRPPSLSSETPARLVTRLSHPNGWWRDTGSASPHRTRRPQRRPHTEEAGGNRSRSTHAAARALDAGRIGQS
jgi:hypothetical protein